MATSRQPIDIAAAIADLTPIDWAALEAEAVQPMDRALLSRLRVLDGVVRACADVPDLTGTLSAVAHPADVPPTTWGPFDVRERVGRGTFGEVYRAYDRRLDRIVALKFLRPDCDRGTLVESEAVHEGRLLAKVHHPNVVTVYGAERIDGRVGVWMEFVDGQTLEQELRASGPLTAAAVVEIGIALCGALAAVHDAGLLHRDLKAQNVIRARDGRILLTDFGAGRVVADGSGGAELAGTPLYLAPEVLTGAPASVASESYSLGVLLYHLATASFPVQGRTLKALREAHAAGQRLSIRAYQDRLPRALVHVIDRATDPDPANRFTSLSDLTLALEGVRRRPRHVWRWAMAGSACVAVLLVAGNLGRPSPTRLEVIGQSDLTPGWTSGFPTLLFARDEQLYYEDTGTVYSISTSVGQQSRPQVVNEAWSDFEIVDTHPTRAEFLALKSEPRDGLELWALPMRSQPRPIGSIRCRFAAWSPNGKQIAIVANNTLAITNDAGTEPRSLPTPPIGVLGNPTWSPDGRRLRFDVSVVDGRTRASAIWQVGEDGSALHQVFEAWNPAPRECCGKWTPDGEYYIFHSRRDQPDSGPELWARREQLGLLSWTQPDPFQLTHSGLDRYWSAPAFGRDSHTLYSVGQEYKGQLVRFDMLTRQFAPSHGGLPGTWVTTSSDQKSVSYISFPDKRLWLARADGSERRQLIISPTEVDGSMWSPNGKWISFIGRLGGECRKIFLLRADEPGQAPRPITTEDRDQGIPSWAPVREQFVFGDVPKNFGIPNGGEVLHIYDMPSRTLSTLPGSEGFYTARWSPDGKYIAALKIDPTMTLHIYSFASKTWRPLPRADNVNNPSWSKDGRYIYYDTANLRPRMLRRVRVDNGDVEDLANLTVLPAAAHWSGLAPDDSPLVLQNLGRTSIYALKLERR